MRGGHDRASRPSAHASKSPTALERDTLSDVLSAVRLSGALFFLVDAGAPWRAEAPAGTSLAPVILPRAQNIISYHLVIDGECWCAMPGVPPLRLVAGDVIVIPHGDAYLLANPRVPYVGSELDALLSVFSDIATGALPRVLTEGGRGRARLQLACGFMGCDSLPFNPVVATLPRLVHLRPSDAPPNDRLRSLLDLALAESRDMRAGSDCVLVRLSELLFVELVRSYVASLGADHTGWLAGLRDPIVARSLALLHAQPAREWTVEQLARTIGVSRSALASRFAHFVGQPPMQYLTRWRMQIAARMLADSAEKVSAVAIHVGYDSEAAFSRAFKKAVGVPPAIWRSRSGHTFE